MQKMKNKKNNMKKNEKWKNNKTEKKPEGNPHSYPHLRGLRYPLWILVSAARFYLPTSFRTSPTDSASFLPSLSMLPSEASFHEVPHTVPNREEWLALPKHPQLRLCISESPQVCLSVSLALFLVFCLFSVFVFPCPVCFRCSVRVCRARFDAIQTSCLALLLVACCCASWCTVLWIPFQHVSLGWCRRFKNADASQSSQEHVYNSFVSTFSCYRRLRNDVMRGESAACDTRFKGHTNLPSPIHN